MCVLRCAAKFHQNRALVFVFVFLSFSLTRHAEQISSLGARGHIHSLSSIASSRRSTTAPLGKSAGSPRDIILYPDRPCPLSSAPLNPDDTYTRTSTHASAVAHNQIITVNELPRRQYGRNYQLWEAADAAERARKKGELRKQVHLVALFELD